jgi:hypothetical protein
MVFSILYRLLDTGNGEYSLGDKGHSLIPDNSDANTKSPLARIAMGRIPT